MEKQSRIKIALPKGRLLAETAALLQQTNLGLSGYKEGARYYWLQSDTLPDLSARFFHEKDIPIQIALGNYDLGICGLDWIEELLAKFPISSLVKVKDLGYGEIRLYMAASTQNGIPTMDEIRQRNEMVRIVSEYPNLAESFALRQRIRRFTVQPLWGAAEAYPPENADLCLLDTTPEELGNHNLRPVCEVLKSRACLIANSKSWQDKDLSQVLDTLNEQLAGRAEPVQEKEPVTVCSEPSPTQQYAEKSGDSIWLALPDGHQQRHVVKLLTRAGIEVENYPSDTGCRRPVVKLDGFVAKAIRPQDMPVQVANGNFDIAITGQDWLREHRCCFPTSPVEMLIDLKYGWVRIVAVVKEESPVQESKGLREAFPDPQTPIRVASEYVNIADRYARVNHLGMYSIVPTYGASEAFVPEDADVLIENTETGGTLRRHNLRIIETLFESTACIIANTESLQDTVKKQRIEQFVEKLRFAVEELEREAD